MRKLCFTLAAVVMTMASARAYQPQYSVAGLFQTEGSGRQVYDFNTGWKFFRGDPAATDPAATDPAAGEPAVPAAARPSFDDSGWAVVTTPHTVQLMPAEASGSRNYQGKAWYRKRFVVPEALSGKEVTLYFEAAMGRTEVYLNGRKVQEHIGGYLPFAVCLGEWGVEAGDTCLVALMTDNSNDKSYPPGKPQYTLDFCYHGGLYRDVWMIATAPVHISDPVTERHVTAGGGVFVHYGEISADRAEIFVDTEIGSRPQADNRPGQAARKGHYQLEVRLCDRAGKILQRRTVSATLEAGSYTRLKTEFTVKNPHLWSPEDPYLYQVNIVLKAGQTPLDGGMVRAGIRKAEFRGSDGFWLNGKPYHQLIGTNRHQDFAYVGNALPDSRHWRDVQLLREGGCTIIRSAHYPQDPAFMDACDELGVFMIVPTPGWQFWNKAPSFEAYVLDDVTQMVRRDRNHPSVLLWEPILNETRFPEDFALKTLQITRDEFPYPGAPLAAADHKSAGVAGNYGVVYGWPQDTAAVRQCVFTREFGENVDDWYAQNNNNRVSRSWGEQAQVSQALALADAYDEMFRSQRKFIGGAQWHSFDHQRGYHPDPYWGGQCDAFRQTKYAWYLFRSQAYPAPENPFIESGPTVFIAHETMPTSGKDIVVFTNCDSVRLILRERDTLVQAAPHVSDGMPHRPVVFKDAYDFWANREVSYFRKSPEQVSVIAEGISGGQVLCRTKNMPARRSTQLRLSLQQPQIPLTANGNDFIVVVAEVTDDNGHVRRLAKDNIVFEVEGEGTLIGDASIGANPRAVEFGSAPALIRSTTVPGKIKVKARVQYEGQMAPKAAEIEFESVAAPFPFCALVETTSAAANVPGDGRQTTAAAGTLSSEERNRLLEEVQQQQQDFGEGRKVK